jgi:hypothetical protein
MKLAYDRLKTLREIDKDVPVAVFDRVEGLLRRVLPSVQRPQIFTDEEGYVTLEWVGAWMTVFADGTVRFLHETASFERISMTDDKVLLQLHGLQLYSL